VTVRAAHRKALYRFTDEGSKPGKRKLLEMLVDGKWHDISAARGIGYGSNYRLHWTDHCVKFFPPYKPLQPLVTYFDKDGNVIDS
jgi:hypothetical protein